MRRRSFLKAAALTSGSLISPISLKAKTNFRDIEFDADTYNNNSAQTIIVFLYGGASELGANLTNIEQIAPLSQNSYEYFENRMRITSNKLWAEAGGDALERLLSAKEANIFRTCYSKIRDANNNKSHGSCVSQNQRGVMSSDDSGGIISTIAQTLYEKGAISSDAKLPFISMEGESILYATPDFTLESFLRPTALAADLSNPYKRRYTNRWYYYNDQERDTKGYNATRAEMDIEMDSLAQSLNIDGDIRANFERRVELEEFIDAIDKTTLPDQIEYDNNDFAQKMESAVKILVNNPDTKMISIGSGGLGSWDDHNEAEDYPARKEALIGAIETALKHMKAEKKDNINIVVWGDFGRNVNLNSSNGWDHGNTQNFYTFGGKRYFNHVGIVGETRLESTGGLNRLFLKPTSTSYTFEPASIAATLYSIYGITNPIYLTGGFDVIKNGLLK